MSMSLAEFEMRLEEGRYDEQVHARRAVFHLAIPEAAKRRAYDAVDRHFGRVWKPTGHPRQAAPPQTFASKLGEVIAAKSERHARAGVAGGKARQRLIREGKQAPPRLAVAPPRAPVAATPVYASVASVPVGPPPASVADVRHEADRMVRELAARMPTPAPAPPEGVEHAFRIIADASRELFETLAANVKDEERLKPDLLRAGRAVAVLLETGAELLKARAHAPRIPNAPPSVEALGEAAQ
jgi:hypothetical protein